MTSAAPEPMMIATGDTLVIIGGDTHRMVTVKKNLLQKLGKVMSVNVGSLIGQPLNIMYEIDEKKRTLVPYHGPTLQDAEEAAAPAVDDGAKQDRDNRNLLDTSTSQAMTQAEIERIKADEGVKGIVNRLVQSSATFDDKTAFSQQKYIRRKRNKYAVTFFVERANPDNMSEIWCPTKRTDAFPQDDHRWLRLRIDTVAQLMHGANINHNSQVLMADRCNGFLQACVLSRLGSDGRVIHVLGPNAQPNMHNAKDMGLSDVKERWKCVRRGDVVGGAAAIVPEATPPALVDEASSPEQGASAPDGKWSGPIAPKVSQWLTPEERRDCLVTNPPNSMIVADDSSTLADDVLELLPLLAVGGSLTVYSPYLERLCDVMRRLVEDCVCLTLRDTWYRAYQVLPNRTHPYVNMTHNGGFILNAIRVDRSTNPFATKAVVKEDGDAAVGTAPPEAKRHRAETGAAASDE